MLREYNMDNFCSLSLWLHLTGVFGIKYFNSSWKHPHLKLESTVILKNVKIIMSKTEQTGDGGY